MSKNIHKQKEEEKTKAMATDFPAATLWPSVRPGKITASSLWWPRKLPSFQSGRRSFEVDKKREIRAGKEEKNKVRRSRKRVKKEEARHGGETRQQQRRVIDPEKGSSAVGPGQSGAAAAAAERPAAAVDPRFLQFLPLQPLTLPSDQPATLTPTRK